jgi:hypothetical protein
MKPLVIPAHAGIQGIFLLSCCLVGGFRFSWIPDHRRSAAVRNDGILGVWS